MLASLLGLVLVGGLPGAAEPLAHPTLDQLKAESALMRAKQPQQWQHAENQVAREFAANQRLRDHWIRPGGPPEPDLSHLKLPLPWLVDRLLQAEMAQGKPDQTERHRHAFLMAVVQSADERRLSALLEYRDLYFVHHPHNRNDKPLALLITQCAPLPWAAEQIIALARKNPPLDPNNLDNSLVYTLANRFASQLPREAKEVAYAYIHRQAPAGPASGSPLKLWDLLFRLDLARARNEILPAFGTPTTLKVQYNLGVVGLLCHYAGPSPEVAVAVRDWLAHEPTLNSFERGQLRVLLLRSDPATELGPAVRYIDRRLAEIQRQHEKSFQLDPDVGGLVGALRFLQTPTADACLARYAFNTVIDERLRLRLLEALVQHGYAQDPELVARWLTEASPPMRQQLRNEASIKWGARGVEVLVKAHQLLRQKHRSPAP